MEFPASASYDDLVYLNRVGEYVYPSVLFCVQEIKDSIYGPNGIFSGVRRYRRPTHQLSGNLGVFRITF